MKDKNDNIKKIVDELRNIQEKSDETTINVLEIDNRLRNIGQVVFEWRTKNSETLNNSNNANDFIYDDTVKRLMSEFNYGDGYIHLSRFLEDMSKKYGERVINQWLYDVLETNVIREYWYGYSVEHMTDFIINLMSTFGNGANLDVIDEIEGDNMDFV